MTVQLETQRRESGIRYSLISAVGSKIATATVQIIALPIAARALGAAEFSLYTMLVASIGWLSLANFGIGPVVITRTADACARSDVRAQQQLLSNTLIPIALFCGLAAGAVWAGTTLLPVAEWLGFGGQVLPRSEINLALVFLTGFVLSQCALSVPEAMQAGHQEQYKVNLAGAIGNAGSLGCLLLASRNATTIIEMILAMNAPLLLVRATNAVIFLARHRHVRPSLRLVERRMMGELFGAGALFSLAGSLGNFLCHQYPVILVGRTAGVIEGGKVAVTLQAVVVCSGLIQTVTSSVFPGMSDSLAREDFAWSQHAYRRMLRFGLGFALLILAGLTLGGEKVFSLWYGGVVQIPAALATGLGVYFVLLTWETLHYSILLAAGWISKSSALFLTRAAVAAGFAALWAHRGAEVVYPCLAGAVFLVTAATFYAKVRAILRVGQPRS